MWKIDVRWEKAFQLYSYTHHKISENIFQKKESLSAACGIYGNVIVFDNLPCLWSIAIRITVRLSSQWGDCCRSEWLNITCYVNSWIFRVLHGVVHQKQLKCYENFSLRGLNVIKVLNRLFPADKVSISNTKFDKVWHFFFMLKISTKFLFVSQKPNTGS